MSRENIPWWYCVDLQVHRYPTSQYMGYPHLHSFNFIYSCGKLCIKSLIDDHGDSD